MSEKRRDDSTRKSGVMYGAVLSLVFSIISFLVVGLVLDKWLNKSPFFVVVGIILGAVIGFVQFIRLISRNP